MPELPDVTVYVECLRARLLDASLDAIRLKSPFLVRTVDPPLRSLEGVVVREVKRIGKRIALGFDSGSWLVIHLMIAGRFRWRPRGAALPGRLGLAAFDFATGTLLLTEAGTRKRASLHVVRDDEGLAALNPGGIDVFTATASQFAETVRRESHTLKRSLTDPRLFDGIGNAYSDEILHRARLSPFVLTRTLADDTIARLHAACRDTLDYWTQRLRAETGDGFPEKVTAFREGMAVHGRYRMSCPACATPVQRIVYATRECNYCPTCQTSGKLLADRALSQLLKRDWPRNLEELEEVKTRARTS